MRAAACLLALAFASGAAGQEHAPGARAGPHDRQAAPKPQPKAPAEEAPTEIRVKADSQGGTTEHSWARGFVDVRLGPVRVQADAMDFYRSVRGDGSVEQKAVFVGNVVFMREEERLSGERLTYDVDSGRGLFENATGYVQPGVQVEAKTIERLDADSYRVTGAHFTSCSQPNPRWSFSLSSARIEVDDKVVGKNAVFKVKNVPAFYIPFFVYPIGTDQRSTGLLFPHFGYSSLRGFNVGGGFFWAMGRSFDQTLYADHYSKFGYGFGHEFRYSLDPPSGGTFSSYGFRRSTTGQWDYDLDWRAGQALPAGARATVNVRRYSDILFQEQFQDSLNRASSRSEYAQFALQRSFPFANVQLLAESRTTSFALQNRANTVQTRANRKLPSLRLWRAPTRIVRAGPTLGFELRGESLERAVNETSDRYGRLLGNLNLSYPMATTFLQVTPRVSGDYTWYDATRVGNRVTGPALGRRYFEALIGIQGPNFSRVFENPSGFYSEKFKHVIGPEFGWRYRTRIEDFIQIPKFDPVDQVLGTNQLEYAIVQRILAKRPGFGGKLQPWELLAWRVGQTYYVQIREAQNEFDPNYSAGAFGPGGVPDHNSPLQSRLRIRPAQNFQTSFDLEYDVNFKQLRTLSVGTQIHNERATLISNWARALRLSEKPEERQVLRNFLRASGSYDLLPGRLLLEGGIDWDIELKQVLQSRAGLRYDIQCCGFTIETVQYDFNSRKDRSLRFSIELANIGSIGNFLGQDPYGSNASGSIGGGRLR